MLVPFAACGDPGCQAALDRLELPRLQRLLARLAPGPLAAGSATSLSTPGERALGAAYGLGTTDGLIPFAALVARQAGLDGADDGWAWITPSHWRVGRDHVAMAHPQDLQLDGDDSRALMEAMAPYFLEDGIRLTFDAPLRWLARGKAFRDLPTASLDRVIGRRIDPWMPAGAPASGIRRLQQEMQMLLYTLPLNDERHRVGLLPVNSFWVSGTGALPPGYDVAQARGVQVSPYLRDAALLGDWRSWSAAWQDLDTRDCTRLLGELEQGRPVRLTLCGESASRTWSSAGASAWRRWASALRAPSPRQLLEGL